MPHPILYEINTRCWLRELSEQHGQPITLANVPETEFLGWARLGFTHVWLMGVWTSGPRALAQVLAKTSMRHELDEALPGWAEADVAASPYAIAEYRVPDELGGEAGLSQFRQHLRSSGLKLVLDFVPNHLGLDHPWVREKPELFVQSPVAHPDTFLQETAAGVHWLAYGRDPNSPPWTDTVQVDYRRADARAALSELMLSIAARCDGVRCDMAMLLLNEVFSATWKHLPAVPPPPATEFWAEAIARTRRSYPEIMFLAEVYWGLGPSLKALGFDYTYDKDLYDGLVGRDGPGVQRHLLALSSGDLRTSAHFLENHDERRIASILSPAEHRAAALLILALPGMRFLHEGQLSGARRRTPVQLARRSHESENAQIKSFYEQMLTVLSATNVGQGNAALLVPRPAWADNPSAQNFILLQWRNSSVEFHLVAINLAPHPAQCYAPLSVPNLSSTAWRVKDLIGPEEFVRAGDDLERRGLYLDLPAHAGQLLRFQPLESKLDV